MPDAPRPDAAAGGLPLPFRCPHCGGALASTGPAWRCPTGHSFDVAREGHVHLLPAGRRKGRAPGDSPEMVRARRTFLGSGAYDGVARAVAEAVRDLVGDAPAVLDVGCGEGRYLRALGDVIPGSRRGGLDVAKDAVRLAARADPAAAYVVASAFALPLPDASVDAVLSVFGPVHPPELARVVRPGGVVVSAHPGAAHLRQLRAVVYADPRPHDEKPPLRGDATFVERSEGSRRVTSSLSLDRPMLDALVLMTPYAWHLDPPARARLAAAPDPFEVDVDVVVTAYERTSVPSPPGAGPSAAGRLGSEDQSDQDPS